MRGTISAGMALALDELGLVPAFDAVYGASAGAITAAWLLSRPQGLRGWTEPAYARTFIRRSGLLRGRPVADVRALIEELYQTTFPMDFAAVLASPIEFHPLATDAATGQSTDLRPLVGTPAELRLALRASAALPLLAGPPVEFARPPLLRRRPVRVRPLPHRAGPGRHARAGAALPPRPADRAGRPRPGPFGPPDRPHHPAPRDPGPARRLPRPRRPPSRRRPPPRRIPVRAAHAEPRSRHSRRRALRRRPRPQPSAPLASPVQLRSATSAPVAPAAVFSIRPPAGSPAVSRLATDGRLLRPRSSPAAPPPTPLAPLTS